MVDLEKEAMSGVNDPVAKKLLSRVRESNAPVPPADLSISTVFVGGIEDQTEEEIRDALRTYGAIKGVKMVHR